METCSADQSKQDSPGIASGVPPCPSGQHVSPGGSSSRIFSQGNVKAPAFQFYASDFIGGTMQFTAEETGVYIRLLCYQWMNGSIPNDQTRIKAIAGILHDSTAIVLPLAKFKVGTDNRLRNERLEAVRAEQDAFRAAKSASGSLGASKRWQKNGTAMISPLANGMANDSSPVSSLHKEKEDPAEPVFVLVSQKFISPQFVKAWNDWMAYRKKLKHPAGGWPSFFEGQLKWLEKRDEKTAIEALENSFRNRWIGLFGPSGKGRPEETGKLTEKEIISQAIR
jgi:uncharacterized protein YdaU (DUF1376 family)